MSLIFYHYPKCKKSRAALDFVRQKGIEPEIVNYVEEGLSEKTLSHLLDLLNVNPIDLVRMNEDFYKENLKQKSLNNQEWVETLVCYPKLLKRPIVVYGAKAVLADPPQNVNQLLTEYKQDL